MLDDFLKKINCYHCVFLVEVEFKLWGLFLVLFTFIGRCAMGLSRLRTGCCVLFIIQFWWVLISDMDSRLLCSSVIAMEKRVKARSSCLCRQ
ncbi:hypothetical protein K438DRAFT_19169 [Mycena galopus ATCC 62051]|nr:hypothetical protein K438DRAFT_19169 [Mycena galopus ATCC 62051]